MSKLEKYRKKIMQVSGNSFDGETNYRVLKKIYVYGGTQKALKICGELIKGITKVVSDTNNNHSLILENKPNINLNRRIMHDNKLMTPLHVFCSKIETFEEGNNIVLVEKGANVNARCSHGCTPLHYAVINSSLPLVRYLVNKGADVDALNKKYLTPIHLSFDTKNEGMMNFLLSKSKRIVDNFQKENNKGGWSYLIYIIKNLRSNVSMETLSRLSASAGVREEGNLLSGNSVIYGDSPLMAVIKKIKDGSQIKFLTDVFEEILIWDESDRIFMEDRKEYGLGNEVKKLGQEIQNLYREKKKKLAK